MAGEREQSDGSTGKGGHYRYEPSATRACDYVYYDDTSDTGDTRLGSQGKGAGMTTQSSGREAFKQSLWQLLLTHLHAWVHRRLGLPPHAPAVPPQTSGGA